MRTTQREPCAQGWNWSPLLVYGWFTEGFDTLALLEELANKPLKQLKH
jgi:hypothetical protein